MDKSQRMRESGGTTLFVPGDPGHCLPALNCGNERWGSRKCLMSSNNGTFCISQCDIYSTKTNNPPTSEFQQNSGLFLTCVVSSLGWRKSSLRTVTQRPISTQGLTRECVEIAYLPFCAWGRRWHMPPSTCKGAGKCALQCAWKEKRTRL